MTVDKLKPITTERIAEIRARNAARTPGRWQWWTSNSFRRLSARGDGDVAYGWMQPSDGHPDIQIREHDMAFIENAPDDITDLLADNDRLRAEQEQWQRATGCIDPETISLALNRIASSIDRSSTEGIPDAIARLKRELAAKASGTKSPAERRADEIEAEAQANGHKVLFEDAVRAALGPKLRSAAWLIIAQRILARETSR